jgi:hypothetical protein
MKGLPNALERFVRIILAYGIVYGLNAVAHGVLGFSIPFFLMPVVSAFLNSIAKWIRDKWQIDIQL